MSDDSVEKTGEDFEAFFATLSDDARINETTKVLMKLAFFKGACAGLDRARETIKREFAE